MKKRRVMIFIISAILILNMVFNFDLRVEAASQNEVVAQLNSLINQYNEKTATANQMIDGKQCKGFANWVFFKLFGAHIGAYPESANYKISNPNAQTLGIIEPGNLNVNTAKSLLQKGAPGDYIQMQRSTARGRGPHSMILVGVNDSGIEVFDCNSDGKNTIKNYTISWESLDVANRAMSLYRAYGYSPSSGTSSVQPGLPDKPVITNLQPVYTNTNTINLTWTAASRAVSYYIDVWKNESEHIFSSDVGNVTSYTLGCFGSDGKYNIAVSALNSAGISYGDYSYTNVLYVADLGKNFHANIALGDSDSLVSAADNGNVEIQTSGGSLNQGWEFQHQSDGSYKIVSTNGSGKCLDVHNYGGSESNVSIVTDNGGAAQRWYIRESSGYYLLTPACAPDCSLDVVGASKTDGTNVNIYSTNRGAAQQLSIRKIEVSSEKPAMSELKSVYTNTDTIKLSWDKIERATSYYIDVWRDGKHIFSSDIGNVTSYDLDCFDSDGKYGITVSAQNIAGIMDGDCFYTYVLHGVNVGDNFDAYIVHSESGKAIAVDDKDNIELQTFDDSRQLWNFQLQSDGSYKIINKNGTKKCLHSSGKQTNVSIVGDNGEPAQRWLIREAGGYYVFTSLYAPDCSLDVGDNPKSDGSVVQTLTTEQNASQLFRIIPSSEEPVCRHDYKQFIKKQETCIETGVKEYVCSKCGDSYIESIPPTGHTWDKGKVTIKATASTDGIYTYTCILCGETKTEKIPATGQTDQNDEDKDKTETDEGKKPDVDGTDKDEDENDSDEEEPDTDDGEESDALDVGDITEDAKSGDEYEIISNNRDVICVKYIESANPKAMIVKIPATIETEEGKVCKVTSISKSAFKNNRKLKKVVIGENVSAIGTKAIFGCKNLSTVTIGKNVVSIGAGAFSNCTKLTRLTIPAKVTRIGANAFSGCKKLRKLEIKSRKLNSKGLNKKSFKGIPKKTLIRVPMDKRKVYKKLLCQKGLRKSNKIR